ncbi:MAG: hypothetical protein HY866_05050 [Chloroflexi bacterium]|nr:hypothetical protein [Chloroflexota bacterium]
MIGIEILAAVLAGSGALIGGGVWLTRRRHQLFINRSRSDWVHDGQIIHFGPVGVTILGQRPRSMYGQGTWGALGISGDQLVFHSPNGRGDFHLPLAAVRQIHLQMVQVWIGKTAARYRALVVHYESSGEWWVATLTSSALEETAQALAKSCGLPVSSAGAVRDDFGPAKATRMDQDVYGEWRRDRPGTLYLALDRLLFDWRDPILLSQIERLDVIPHGGRGLFAADLLRIETTTPEGDRAVSGFVVRHAARWAQAVARRSDQTLPVWAGRKKKY